MLENKEHLDYAILAKVSARLISELDDEIQEKKVAGGKLGAEAGQLGAEAGQLGAEAGKAQGKKVVEIRTNLEFDTVSDYAKYLGQNRQWVHRHKDMWMYL